MKRKGKLSKKFDKAKHGLRIRPKISFFGFGKARALRRRREGERREEEKKKEERKKRRRIKARYGINVWKSCLEHLLCDVWNLYVWKYLFKLG